ncbi:MAG: N-acyl-D-glucosamine 2-epimerase, partial [Victivallaceae bacterium]
YFAIGFAPGPGGIVKSYDLIARRVVNSDMPWWSLPETIRAAALTSEFTGETVRTGEIMKKCAAAFLRGYVRPELNRMAVQTRNDRGEVVPVIPATPDADPGYHTNLSIIDALPALRRLD